MTNSSCDNEISQTELARVWLIRTSSILSMISCTFIIFWIRFKDRDRATRNQLINLHLADGLSALIYFISTTSVVCEEGAACAGQGAAIQLFYLASVLWTSAIAWYLHRVIYYGKPQFGLWLPALVCWGWPILTVIIGLSTNSFKKVSTEKQWCWIRRPWKQFVFMYIPVILVFFYNFHKFMMLRSRISHNYPQFPASAQRRLLAYMGVYFVCNIWAIVFAFMNLAGAKNLAWVALLDSFFEPLQGLLHSLAYNYKPKSTLDRDYTDLGISNKTAPLLSQPPATSFLAKTSKTKN
eukprot:c4687_g1_i1.p1 GENE.c4687_g1_i1~~c4687_g1_i1.p1  ORF type:complete len:295 (+),score=39.76 c4687_g1_i1:57-941(+)